MVEMNEQLIREIVSRVLQAMDEPKDEVQPKQLKVLDESKVLFKEIGPAKYSSDIKEVAVGIAPAFGVTIHKTINGLSHEQVLKEILAGIEEEGMTPRIIRVTKSSDVAFIGNQVAKLAGSGIGIGIQSKGTVVIHQKNLYPLTNLELFPQAPSLTLEIYRQIGKNAARYAKGEVVKPIVVPNDIYVRPKYQVKAALMHTKETELVDRNGDYIEIENPFKKGSV